MPKIRRDYKLYKYSNNDLDSALEKISKGESFGKVAKESKIPKSTLFAKFSKRIPLRAKKGPKPLLLEEEENRIKTWLLDNARLGFPMNSEEIKLAAQKILNETKRKTRLKYNKPGGKWLLLFLDRHPEIKKMNAEINSKSRAPVTEQKLRDWFSNVKSYCYEKNILYVLNRPTSIFNGHETEFGQNENIRLLCSFSAAGATVPPMVILPHKKSPAHLVAQYIPSDWSVGFSESGWTMSNMFYQYIAYVFHPWCVHNNVTFPVIYFLDGRKSRLSLELSDFCRQNSITLVSLLPNSTHITQPCDVSVFKTLKLKWDNLVLKHGKTSLTNAIFASLLKTTFDQLTTETIQIGFKKCGLYPFDENVIDYDQCISNSKQGTNNEKSVESTKVSLTYNDYLSTKKFFDNVIEKEKLKKFAKFRNSNQSCSDAVYLLWKTCVDKLEVNTSQTDLNQIHDEQSVEFEDSTDENSIMSNKNVNDGNNMIVMYSDENIKISINGDIDLSIFK